MIRQGALTQGELHLAFWTERLTKPSAFVYVLQGDPGTPIKVGVAKDVEARVDSLQTGNPQLLRLLHIVPGDYILEWNFHQRLKQDRIRGEWFEGELVPDFLAFVERMADKMVAAYDGSGRPPHYERFGTFDLRGPKIKLPVKPKLERPKNWRSGRGPATEVKVRFIKPEPKTPPDVARQMRESVKGCSRSAYLGPANTAARQRISPSLGFNN